LGLPELKSFSQQNAIPDRYEVIFHSSGHPKLPLLSFALFSTSQPSKARSDDYAQTLVVTGYQHHRCRLQGFFLPS
jgi:hypothetical protein